jgi:transposase
MDTAPPMAQTLDEANALLAVLWAELVRLRERVAELEARLGQNSSNSSRPPSSDPPSAPAPARGGPSGRKRGGQPGHVAHQRILVPPERVDRVVEHWPAVCRHCQAALPADPDLVVADAAVHQVTELPPVRAEVTEHRLQRLRCPCCGVETRATLPPDVPGGAFGPRLQATVALLTGRYHLSRRAVAAICAEVLGAPVALGSVAGLCQATSAALAEPVTAAEQAVRTAAVANADETSWLQAGKICWLWVVVTARATVFRIAASRSGKVLQAMLTEQFTGHVGSDRWTGYLWLGVDRRQVCWAHLKRDFQALVDRGGAAREVGEPALALAARLFVAWHAARDDPAARTRLPQAMQPAQDEFRALLTSGTESPNAKAAGLCRALLDLWPALWTFVTVPGVEPTNNAAERALRPAVLWRKQSFGSQCDAGARFVERLLCVVTTCQQQQRSALDYLTAVCSAAQHGSAIPALVPALPP